MAAHKAVASFPFYFNLLLMRRLQRSAALVTTCFFLIFLQALTATASQEPASSTSSSSAAQSTSDQNTAAKPSRSFLFALSGDTASLKPVSGKPGTFRLVAPLKSIDERVNWFTDRPARDAGTLPLTQFINLWSQDGANSFKNDPPNIALAHNNRTLIAVMTAPEVVNSSSGKVFRATLKSLPTVQRTALSQGDGNLSTHSKREAITPGKATQKLGNFSLFIDNEAGCSGDCCCYCLGGSNCGEDCYPGVNGLTICGVICGTNCNDYCAWFG